MPISNASTCIWNWIICMKKGFISIMLEDSHSHNTCYQHLLFVFVSLLKVYSIPKDRPWLLRLKILYFNEHMSWYGKILSSIFSKLLSWNKKSVLYIPRKVMEGSLPLYVTQYAIHCLVVLNIYFSIDLTNDLYVWPWPLKHRHTTVLYATHRLVVVNIYVRYPKDPFITLWAMKSSLLDLKILIIYCELWKLIYLTYGLYA